MATNRFPGYKVEHKNLMSHPIRINKDLIIYYIIGFFKYEHRYSQEISFEFPKLGRSGVLRV